MRALVTGASGFIGARLLPALQAAGWEVRAYVHRTPLAPASGVFSFSGDILDEGALAAAMAGADAVFHLAAAVGSAVTDRRAFHAVNVEGTRAVLRAARAARIGRVVHFSSIGVLGAVRDNDTADEDYPPVPRTPYDRTKLAAEEAAREAAAAGLDVVILRPGWVYGPGDRRTFKFFRAVCRRRAALIAGARGRQTPVYIDDLVSGVLLAAARGRPGAVYHLAGDEVLDAAEMTRLAAEACGVAPPRLRLPLALARPAAGILEKAFALARREAPFNRGKLAFFTDSKAMSSQRAQTELGFAPQKDFRAGVRQAIAWYRENGWL